MAFSWEAIVSERDDDRLLRDVLRDTVGLSQRLLHALKFQGSITLNGIPVTVRARVRQGDQIVLVLPELAEQRVIPEELPLHPIHEDEDLLIVNKPAGMIVHPVPPEPKGTLANAIAWHWQSQGLNQPVRVVTRLDRDTTGLVLVAKNALTQHYYSTVPGALSKHYLALLCGCPDTTGGVIDAPIAINPENPVTRRIDQAGKPAQTAWKLIECRAKYCLVQAELLTGRTHQIRVHFAALGHPLLGDAQYGGASDLIARQALHCHRLQLRHVRSGKDLQLTASLPDDIKNLCTIFTLGAVQR